MEDYPGPGIFFDHRERNSRLDSYYAVLGRALFLATRFESGCKAVIMMLGVKSGKLSLSSAESSEDVVALLTEFARSENAKPLNQAIQAVTAPAMNSPFASALDAARRARNEIAHEAAMSFDYSVTTPDALAETYAAIRLAVQSIAQADLLISILLSRLSGEPLLAGDLLASYANDLTDWVCRVEPPDA